MYLGCLLKSQNRLAAVASMRVATGQEFRLGDPRAIFVTPHLNLGNLNDHTVKNVSDCVGAVNSSTSSK
jgi:hypothetical protein